MAVSARNSRTCRSAGGVLRSRRQSRLALTSLAWRTSNTEVQFLGPTCNGRLPICEVRTCQNNWPARLLSATPARSHPEPDHRLDQLRIPQARFLRALSTALVARHSVARGRLG